MTTTTKPTFTFQLAAVVTCADCRIVQSFPRWDHERDESAAVWRSERWRNGHVRECPGAPAKTWIAEFDEHIEGLVAAAADTLLNHPDSKIDDITNEVSGGSYYVVHPAEAWRVVRDIDDGSGLEAALGLGADADNLPTWAAMETVRHLVRSKLERAECPCGPDACGGEGLCHAPEIAEGICYGCECHEGRCWPCQRMERAAAG